MAATSENERLAGLAMEYGLPGIAAAIRDSSKTFVAAPPVLTQRAPLERTLPTRLAALVRRGLNDGDLAVVTESFDAAPLERGLIAWSALKTRLFKTAETRAKEQQHAAAIAPLIVDRGECWLQRDEAAMTQLLDQLATGPFEAFANGALVDELPKGYRLGAIELLRRRVGRDLLLEEKVLERCREFAWLLSLGRLTSLSWFYFQYLWRICRYATAVSELCDLALDERAYGLLPTDEEWAELGSPSFREVRAYVTGRALLGAGKLPEAQQTLAALPADAAGTYALLLQAELELRQGALKMPIGPLGELAQKRPLWKHAHRLFVVASLRGAAGQDQKGLSLYDGFEAAFGFDLRTFGMCQIGASPELRAALESRLIRNLLQMPFDASLWMDLATRLSGTPRLWQELRAVRTAA